jgi:hypothetical protein
MAEEEEYNKGGYESMVWIRDKDGKDCCCSERQFKDQGRIDRRRKRKLHGCKPVDRY